MNTKVIVLEKKAQDDVLEMREHVGVIEPAEYDSRVTDDVILRNTRSEDSFIKQLYADLNTRIEEFEGQESEVKRITLLDFSVPLFLVFAISLYLIYLIWN
ncbi:hypothetical protein CVD25_05430 [Bacillus canaveralius]|uniref:Uncharacterized protein n=1 Tax=Bacillus canaveralius TaxID=1403243 RepID=A0A2N5GLD4_9BACI|nr:MULTISPECIES: hypothetical protein [Bacillus]PLR81275.1 hypothetical protein CVD23_19475 [Bacillus sp. V33-4]PLR82321.1 hypothetical protein CU635_12280 [Bacillus canaveralius]PLR99442.1 hypothetical protein CVD25_05430 [Bacillus canaveralius]RSK49120.1 hypothetical protein EJA13_16280 [Bacillus canaveralius]